MYLAVQPWGVLRCFVYTAMVLTVCSEELGGFLCLGLSHIVTCWEGPSCLDSSLESQHMVIVLFDTTFAYVTNFCCSNGLCNQGFTFQLIFNFIMENSHCMFNICYCLHTYLSIFISSNLNIGITDNTSSSLRKQAR